MKLTSYRSRENASIKLSSNGYQCAATSTGMHRSVMCDTDILPSPQAIAPSFSPRTILKLLVPACRAGLSYFISAQLGHTQQAEDFVENSSRENQAPTYARYKAAHRPKLLQIDTNAAERQATGRMHRVYGSPSPELEDPASRPSRLTDPLLPCFGTESRRRASHGMASSCVRLYRLSISRLTRVVFTTQ